MARREWRRRGPGREIAYGWGVPVRGMYDYSLDYGNLGGPETDSESIPGYDTEPPDWSGPAPRYERDHWAAREPAFERRFVPDRSPRGWPARARWNTGRGWEPGRGPTYDADYRGRGYDPQYGRRVGYGDEYGGERRGHEGAYRGDRWRWGSSQWPERAWRPPYGFEYARGTYELESRRRPGRARRMFCLDEDGWGHAPPWGRTGEPPWARTGEPPWGGTAEPPRGRTGEPPWGRTGESPWSSGGRFGSAPARGPERLRPRRGGGVAPAED